VEIHYSTVFDGRTPTLCGVASVPKPATSEWRYVSCRACLMLGARTSKDAAARLRGSEAAATAEPPSRPITEAEIRKLSGADDPVFQRWLADLNEERLRIGREIQARMGADATGEGPASPLRR